MGEFRFKQLHGASPGNGLDIHHPPDPLNDSLNCRRLTLLTAAPGGVGKGLKNQEEVAQIPRGAPGTQQSSPQSRQTGMSSWKLVAGVSRELWNDDQDTCPAWLKSQTLPTFPSSRSQLCLFSFALFVFPPSHAHSRK